MILLKEFSQERGVDMDITVYNNSSDKRVIGKTMTALTTYTGVYLKDDTDLINPTFRLTKLSNPTNMHKVNYLYCDHFCRYYYVNNIRYCKGGIVELECHVDVLESFKTQLLNKKAYVIRQENARDKKNYFYDDKYPIRSDVTVYPIKIGTVGSGVGYYLTTNGGVQ